MTGTLAACTASRTRSHPADEVPGVSAASARRPRLPALYFSLGSRRPGRRREPTGARGRGSCVALRDLRYVLGGLRQPRPGRGTRIARGTRGRAPCSRPKEWQVRHARVGTRASVREIKWSRGESNPRPLECDSSALPTELRPHRREEPEQSRAYSPTAPAGQPVSRARTQGEPAPGTSTVVARIRAPRWARASARGMPVAARTKSVRRSTPPSMHAMT